MSATVSTRPASAPPPFDVEKIREDFPILETRVGSHALVYLDNAATTQKPRQVIDAVETFYSSRNANIHRGVHYLSGAATDAYDKARTVVARFLNAPEAAQCLFVRGTTEAINLVASCWGRANLKAGDEILLSAMEHHANIVPWQVVAQQTGAVVRVIPINDQGELLMEEFEKLLSPRVKLVSVVHVSNALGTVNPVGDIIRKAHAVGAKVLVDAAQSVSHLPVDVQALDCDFLALSGHKIFGPTGIGVLYGRAEILRSMPPYQTGGDMIQRVSWEGTTYRDIPERFEAGTPHISGAIALGAALRYMMEIDRGGAAAHEAALLAEATALVSEIPGLRVVGTAASKASVLSFMLKDVHPHDIGTILDSDGIAIRAGHHCAQPLMKRLGLPGTARASFAFYNTREEVQKFATSLRKIQSLFR